MCSASRNTCTTELMFSNLLIFWTCNISHPSFQTSWAVLLETLFWAHKEKDAGDSWIPTSEMSVLHDRVHSSCLSWSMASATGEHQELSSGKTEFPHDFRNINCDAKLQRNRRTGYQLYWVCMTKLLLVGVLQEWLLWEADGRFLHVQES